MTARNHEYSSELIRDDPTEWVDKYGDALFRYAVSKVGARDTAEELVQETLLAALDRRNSFRGKSSSLTWLIGILRRKIVDEFRRRERDIGRWNAAPAANSQSEKNRAGRRNYHKKAADRSADPQRVLERHEFWEILDECLASLPPQFAGAFLLRDVQQADTAVACELLEISPAHLFVRLHRARLLMRQCLEIKWFDGPMVE